MGFIDELLDVNKCDESIKEQHDFNVSKLNKRKLQINIDKSARIHIRNKKRQVPRKQM